MKSQFVTQENAQRNEDCYHSPLRQSLSQCTWMICLTVQNTKKRVELYHQLKAPWSEANMQARKRILIFPKVVEAIPEIASEVVISSGQDPITKTLGVS